MLVISVNYIPFVNIYDSPLGFFLRVKIWIYQIFAISKKSNTRAVCDDQHETNSTCTLKKPVGTERRDLSQQHQWGKPSVTQLHLLTESIQEERGKSKLWDVPMRQLAWMFQKCQYVK